MPDIIGWSKKPPVPGDRIAAYYYICEFMWAMQELEQITENNPLAQFPKWCKSWGNVYIASVTISGDNLLIVCEDADGLSPGWVVDRYVNYSDPVGDPNGFIPENYDCWINNLPEPRMRLRARVLSNTADTLTCLNTNPSWDFSHTLASLIDLPLELVKQAGQTRLERWLIGPNDWEYAFGIVGADSTADAVVLMGQDGTSSVSFPADRFVTVDPSDPGNPVGYDFISRFAGKWRRPKIVANDGSGTIGVENTWGDPDVGVGWWIQKTGGIWYEDVATALVQLYTGAYKRDGGTKPTLLSRWYGGLSNGFLSHLPEVESGNADPAALGTFAWVARPTYPRIIDALGATTTEPILDRDFYIEYDDEFNTPRDHYLSPDLWQTIRQWIGHLEAKCASFAEKRITWYGYKGLNFSNFTTATLYRHLNVNWCECEITSVDGSGVATISGMSLTLPRTPTYAYWTLRGPLGQNADVLAVDHGPYNGQVDKRGVLTATTISAGAHPSFGFTAGDVGRKLTISLGPDCYRPLEQRWPFDCEVFIPDTRTEEDVTEVLDPPREPHVDDGFDGPGPGTFHTRPASTKYKTHDELGRVIEGDRAFAIGDVFRLGGENFGDPTTSDSGTPVGPIVPYYANTYYQKPGSGLPTQTLSFVATAGGAGYARNDDNDFYMGRGILYTIEGVATDGGANMLIDADKNESGFFRDPNRKLLKRGILIQKDIDSGAIVAYRPITDHTVDGSFVPTLTLATGTGPAIEEGTPYMIEIPKYERNHWQGRKVELTPPVGAKQITPVLYSDRHGIYFDTAIVAGPGWTVKILDPKIGFVYQRTGTGPADFDWATGTDSTTNRAFPDDAKNPFPTTRPGLVHEYGRPMNGDYRLMLLELVYRMCNVLDELISGHSWDDLDEENYRAVGDQFASWDNGGATNYGAAAGNFSAGHSHFWSNVGDNQHPDPPNSNTSCTANIKVTGGDTPPQAFVQYSAATQDGSSGALIGSRWAAYHHGKVENGHLSIPSFIDFYALGALAAGNPDEVDDTLPGGGFTRQKFDAMGTPLQFRDWVKWHTLAADVGAERITTASLGSLNAPAMPAPGPNPELPNPGDGAWSYANGFYVYRETTVRRFQKKFHG